MFVGISDFKSAIAVENILTPYKKGRLSQDKKTRLPKEPITPQVCMEVLQSTNYARNIKDMLECIAKLPTSEQAQFKEVVLATFTQREQPQAILDLGQKLAETSGYAERLLKVKMSQEGKCFLSSPQLKKMYVSTRGDADGQDWFAYERLVCLNENMLNATEATNLPPEIDASVTNLLIFDKCNMKRVEILKMKDGVHASFKEVSYLPHDLDVSRCAYLNLYGVDVGALDNLKFRDGAVVSLDDAVNVPFDLDVSPCSSITLDWQDLASFDRLKFRDGAKVYLRQCQNLPHDLDVSQCAEVDFEEDDLSVLDSLRGKDGATLLFNHVCKFPRYFDVSQCNVLRFNSADLNDLPYLELKDGVELHLNNAKTVSPLWDVTKCSVYSARFCNFWGFDELKFREGAIVDLFEASHLPQNLDLTNCAEVELGGCDLSKYQELTFGNGAEVKFSRCDKTTTKMPKTIDFSRCKKVWFGDRLADFSATKRIVFANSQQKNLSYINIPQGWNGEIVFADEQREADLNLAMLAKTKGGR